MRTIIFLVFGIFILISLNFVFGASIEDVGSVVDMDKAELQGEGVDYSILNEAETRENGAVVSIKIVDEDGSFCVRGNCYENIDKSKTNYFDLDAEGNIVSASFVTTGEGNYTLGEDEYFLPKGTSVEFREGKAVLSGDGDFKIRKDGCKDQSISFIERFREGDLIIENMKGCERRLKSRQIIFLINNDSYYCGFCDVTLDEYGRLQKIEKGTRLVGGPPKFYNFRHESVNQNTNFYYNSNFNPEEHENENYINIDGNKWSIGGENLKVDFGPTSSLFLGIDESFTFFELTASGKTNIYVDNGKIRVDSFGYSDLETENLNVFTSNNGKIFKKIMSNTYNEVGEDVSKADMLITTFNEHENIVSTMNVDKEGSIFSEEGDFSLYSSPATDTIVSPDERLNKFEDRDKAREQLRNEGITDERRQAYLPEVSEFLYKHINAICDYENYNLGFVNNLVGAFENNEDHCISFWERKIAKGGSYVPEDLLRAYMGLPQKYGSLGVSDYQPSISTENKYYYKVNNFISGENINFLLERISLGEGDEIIERKSGDSIVFGGTLGKYTLSRGKDSCGFYISYYDIWDLEPNLLEGFVGKPFELYDRVYYEPLTYEIIENPCGNE